MKGRDLARAFALLLTAVTSLWTAKVDAAVTTNYTAEVTCRGVTYQDEENIFRNGGSLSVSVNTEVVCPIIKTTSGPSITNDMVTSVNAQFSMGTASCKYTEYSTNIVSSSNTLGQASNNSSGYVYSMNFYGATTNYWGDANNWKYAELRCTFYGNFHGLTVVEAGTNQSGRRITSAAGCGQDTDLGAYSTSPYWHYEGASGQKGGFFKAVGGQSGFHARCNMPAGSGSKVDVRLGPGIATQQMGCKRHSTWLSVTPGSEWNFQTIKFTSGGIAQVSCYMSGYPVNGDGKVLSLRTYN